MQSLKDQKVGPVTVTEKNELLLLQRTSFEGSSQLAVKYIIIKENTQTLYKTFYKSSYHCLQVLRVN